MINLNRNIKKSDIKLKISNIYGFDISLLKTITDTNFLSFMNGNKKIIDNFMDKYKTDYNIDNIKKIYNFYNEYNEKILEKILENSNYIYLYSKYEKDIFDVIDMLHNLTKNEWKELINTYKKEDPEFYEIIKHEEQINKMKEARKKREEEELKNKKEILVEISKLRNLEENEFERYNNYDLNKLKCIYNEEIKRTEYLNRLKSIKNIYIDEIDEDIVDSLIENTEDIDITEYLCIETHDNFNDIKEFINNITEEKDSNSIVKKICYENAYEYENNNNDTAINYKEDKREILDKFNLIISEKYTKEELKEKFKISFKDYEFSDETLIYIINVVLVDYLINIINQINEQNKKLYEYIKDIDKN